jgi:hypothetical protein
MEDRAHEQLAKNASMPSRPAAAAGRFRARLLGGILNSSSQARQSWYN